MPTSQPQHAVPTTNPVIASRNKRKKIHAGKVSLIMVAIILTILLAAYGAVALYLSDRFMPNSTAINIDLSLMTKSEAENALQSRLDEYTLTLEGEGFKTEIGTQDAGLTVDTSMVVDTMLSTTNPWEWPVQIFKSHDLSEQLLQGTTGPALEEAVRERVEEFNTTTTEPKDATISYDSNSGTFIVVPETIGTALNPDAVVAVAEEALSTLSRKAEITAEELKQPAIFSSDPRLEQAKQTANQMISTTLTLTMDEHPISELTGSTLAPWITTDAEGNATLDDEQLNAWIAEVASSNNTVGSSRSFTNPVGKGVSVSGGVYGWEINQEELSSLVKSAIEQGSTQTIEVPTVSHGTVYEGQGKPDWGPRYMDVDLVEQHARFYDEGGNLIWESDIISGKPNGEYDTPTGVYWMNRKSSPSTLMGYNGNEKIYETEVQYWMPFVGNAIGFHDADWQTAGFGGTLYADGYGSHGCVNLPPSKAAELYPLITEGDTVVVHL